MRVRVCAYIHFLLITIFSPSHYRATLTRDDVHTAVSRVLLRVTFLENQTVRLTPRCHSPRIRQGTHG